MGKRFSGSTDTIFTQSPYQESFRRLAAAGFRDLAVDRIGYGKSSKPLIPYNFNFVAANMKALMDELGVEQVAAVGHSMGGMVVSRFSMLYPDNVTHVAMVNQIGLTDSRQRAEPGVTPWHLIQVCLLTSQFCGVIAATIRLSGHQRTWNMCVASTVRP